MKILIKKIILESILDDINEELYSKLNPKRDYLILNKKGTKIEAKPLEDLYDDQKKPLTMGEISESVLSDTKNKIVSKFIKSDKPTTDTTKELSKLGLANIDRGNLQVFKGQARHAQGMNLEENINNWRDKRTKVISAADKLALSKKDATIPTKSKNDLSSHYDIQQTHPTRNPKPGQKFLLRNN